MDKINTVLFKNVLKITNVSTWIISNVDNINQDYNI